MARPRYGPRHQRARKAMLRGWQPGDLCPRCHHPTDPRLDKLHADHDEHGGYLGLSHGSPCRVCGARCNLAAGGTKSAQLAGKRPRQRTCIICGAPFVAARGRTSAVQETCGCRSCVAELKASRRARRSDPEPPDATGREW